MTNLFKTLKRHSRGLILAAFAAALFALWFGLWLRVLPLKPRTSFTLPQGGWNHLDTIGGFRMLTCMRPGNAARDVGPLRVWDLATGKQIAEFLDHESFVTALGLSTNGDKLVCQIHSDDTEHSELRLFDVGTGSELVNLRGGQGGFSFHLSPDGRWLAVIPSGGQEPTDELTLLYNTESGELLGNLRSESRASSRDELWFAPDSRSVAIWRARENSLELWQVPSRRLIGVVKDTESILAFAPDSRSLAAANTVRGNQARSVSLVDVRTGEVRSVLVGHQFSVTHLAFGPDSQGVIALHWPIGERGAMHAISWEASTGGILGRYENADDSSYSPVLPDVYRSSHIVDIRGDKASLLSLATYERRGTLPPEAFERGWPTMSPDGKFVAFREKGQRSDNEGFSLLKAFADQRAPDSPWADESRLVVWDLAANREIARLAHSHHAWITPDSQMLVTYSRSGIVHVWNMPPRRPIFLMLALAAAPTLLFTGALWWRWGRS